MEDLVESKALSHQKTLQQTKNGEMPEILKNFPTLNRVLFWVTGEAGAHSLRDGVR